MASRPERRAVNDSEIARTVRRALEGYFRDLDGERPCALHEVVMASVEMPLLEYVMHRAQGNQTHAAELLGMNRNTLRKRLKVYGLI